MVKKSLITLVFCMFLVSSFSCGGMRGRVLYNHYEGKEIYTRVNMRFDGQINQGFYIAYKRLTLLLVNSKVRITKVKSGGFKMKISSGPVISVGYRKKWGGKPINDILPLLFSESDISTELSQLNEIEKRGIKIGKALVGMSKKAVIVALGYPAVHKTPSTEQDIWTYWQNRFITYQVDFKDNKVIAVGEHGR